MKFLIDRNLSPRWIEFLQAEGWDSMHSSRFGRAVATDQELTEWARRKRRIVLTYDLDFGAMLAATRANTPSVAQIQTQDVRPESIAPLLVALLRKYENELVGGMPPFKDCSSRQALRSIRSYEQKQSVTQDG